MTVSSPTTQPDPSTPTPHALPRTFTTLWRASSTCGSRAIPAFGGGTFAVGPSMCGNGSSARSVLSSGPVGGRIALSWRRIADCWTSRRTSGSARSATAPSTQAIRSPTQAVRTAPSAPSAAANAGDRKRARRRAPTPSKPGREHAAGHDRPDQRERRCPLRFAPAGENQGGDPCSQPRAGDETDEREHAGDEPLRPPKEPEEHDGPHDHPIDACQESERTRTLETARPDQRAPMAAHPPPDHTAPHDAASPRSTARPRRGCVPHRPGGRRPPRAGRTPARHGVHHRLGARRLRGDARDADARDAEVELGHRLRERLSRRRRHRDDREARGRPRLEPARRMVTVPIAVRRGSSATSTRRSRSRSARTPTATRRSPGTRSSCSRACSRARS